MKTKWGCCEGLFLFYTKTAFCHVGSLPLDDCDDADGLSRASLGLVNQIQADVKREQK